MQPPTPLYGGLGVKRHAPDTARQIRDVRSTARLCPPTKWPHLSYRGMKYSLTLIVGRLLLQQIDSFYTNNQQYNAPENIRQVRFNENSP